MSELCEPKITTFDPKQKILDQVEQAGGWVNAHAHIDRAYTLTEVNFPMTAATLQEKWDLTDEYKSSATENEIYDHMAMAVEAMIEQGAQALGTFIDVDPVIKDKAINAMIKLRERYEGDIQIVVANQVVKGVIEPQARYWFEQGAQYADIVGGLPEKDALNKAEHLDILFETAINNGGKLLHVHVDQFNSPDQRDTELLVDKTIEHGYEGKVTAVHSLSVAAQPKAYRQELYSRMSEAGISVIACPAAWIDDRRKEVLAPSHNSTTPVEEMLEAGLVVAIGTDNIQDIYKPYIDGDMWTELKFLLESCHLYDVKTLARIATINGLKTLGLK